MCGAKMRLADRISKWIKRRVEEAGAKGVVVGLSGGLDSSVVAVLSQRAVGDKVLGIVMPCYSNPADEEDVHLLRVKFGVKIERVVLDPVYDKLLEILPSGNRIAQANLKSRLRMLTLYYFANKLNYLVAGTGNKSEIMVGYFTKYGDGSADFLPLGGLLKTQVIELAKELGIPSKIIEKIPTAGLWEGQTDEGELGISYAELDNALLSICQEVTLDSTISSTKSQVAGSRSSHLPRVTAPTGLGTRTGVDFPEGWLRRQGSARRIRSKVEKLLKVSAHKREPVPIFNP